MRPTLTLLIVLLLALSARAQERVRNVRVSVTDLSLLEIRYDLLNARYGDSVYFTVRSRLRGTLRVSPDFVKGDVGLGMVAGSDHRILWNAPANGYFLNEEIQVIVRVKTGVRTPPPSLPSVAEKPAPATTSPPPSAPVVAVEPEKSATPILPSSPTVADTIRPAPPATQPALPAQPLNPADLIPPKKIRYAGPAWALLSAVAPGVGNIFVQWPKPKVGLRPLLTLGCYGLAVYGLLEKRQSDDAYATYQQQKNAVVAEPFYTTANEYYHRYYLATRAALTVAAADVILTFIKGLRNSQLQQEARRYRSVTIRPGLLAGQPTAVIRYSFH